MSRYKQCEGSGQVANNLDYVLSPEYPPYNGEVGKCSVCDKEVKVYKPKRWWDKAVKKARAHKDTRKEYQKWQTQ
jgi:hypothetical protein